MRRIQYHSYGGPETMKLEDFQLRAPAKGEVAVRVKFAAVNPIDWKVRNGHLKMVTGKVFPRAMGSDFSGTVISVGNGVTRFKPGDAVFGLAQIKHGGALGEAVVAPETFLARKPDNVSFEDAACLGTPGVTAWNGVVDKGDLKAGDHVFVNGCSGAVGEAAVQIALAGGASVSGSCSSVTVQRAQDLGVKPVFDYAKANVAGIKDRFDIVYDTAATMTVGTGLGLLRSGGVFLDIDPTPAKFLRSFLNRKLKPIICAPRSDIMDGLANLAAQGKLRLPVAEIVSLRDSIRLVVDLEKGRKLYGKGLVAVS